MRVVVTGASGFVGNALVARLAASPATEVLTVSRRPMEALPGAVRTARIGDVTGRTCWTSALAGANAVVHTAARVHVMDDRSADPLAEYRQVNTEGTLNLARQAAATGVRRFVFLSSIKVSGERTEVGRPLTAEMPPRPLDPYGLSKLEAERGLQQIARESEMEVVIIRPPLVYGPGVKGNFLTLMRLLRRGLPLPLGAIHNRRSLVALDNLVDLIVACLDHPAAANEIFLVSDGEDLSTSDLLRRLAAAMGVPARLLPVPAWVLKAGAAALGRRGVAQRLCGDLQVDISKTRELLGWSPPVTVDEGLRRAAAGFRG